MRRRAGQDRRWWIAASALALGLCCVIAFSRAIGSDYGNIDCHLRDAYCDDAQPALDALVRGNLGDFFSRQPMMGPVTLVLRAPFLAVGRIWSSDPKLAYQLGSLACLLVLAALAVAVAAILRRRGRPLWQQTLAIVLILANPVVFKALGFGHPEELVASALCIAAALAAIAGRPWLMGICIGAALASKPWALLVVPALALAAPNREFLLRASLAAGIVVLVAFVPMAVGDFGRLRGSLGAANRLGTVPGSVTPANVWWFLGSERAPFQRAVAVTSEGTITTQPETGFVLNHAIIPITHPIIVGLAALLALLWARDTRRRRKPESLLLLFALIFLMRCVLDPGNWSYYHGPAVACLATYELIVRRGVPWATLWLVACIEATVRLSPSIHTDAGFGALYLAWALPTLLALGVWTLRAQKTGPVPD